MTAGGSRRKIMKNIQTTKSGALASNPLVLSSQNYLSGTTNSGSQTAMLRLNSGDLGGINSRENSVARIGSRGRLTPNRVSRKIKTSNRPQTAMNQRGLHNSNVASSMKKIDRQSKG